MRFEKDMSNPKVGNVNVSFEKADLDAILKAFAKMPDVCRDQQLTDIEKTIHEGVELYKKNGRYSATMSPNTAKLLTTMTNPGLIATDDPDIWTALLDTPTHTSYNLFSKDENAIAIVVYNPPWEDQNSIMETLLQAMKDHKARKFGAESIRNYMSDALVRAGYHAATIAPSQEA